MKTLVEVCEKSNAPSVVIHESGEIISENKAFINHFEIFKSEDFLQGYFLFFNPVMLPKSTGKIEISVSGQSNPLLVFCSSMEDEGKRFWLLHFLTEKQPNPELKSIDYLENRKVMVFLLDNDGTIKACEKSTQSILSIPEDQLINRNIRDLQFDPNVLQSILDSFDSCRETGNLKEIFYPIIYKGFQRSFVAKVQFILDSELFEIQVEDRTEELKNIKPELEEKNQELRQSKKFLQGIIESSLDMIIATDPDNIIIEFNKAAEENFGYLRDEVIGKPISILYQDKMQSKAIREGMKKDGKFLGEVENISKDGRIFHSYLSASYLKDLDGKVYGSMGVARNVSNIKNSRRILEQQNMRFSKIFQGNQNLVMFTVDNTLKVTSHNEFFDFLLRKQNLSTEKEVSIEHLFQILKPFLQEDQLSLLWNKYLQSSQGIPQQFETFIINEDGEKKWFEVFINPLLVDNALVEISCLAYEITQKRQNIINRLNEKDLLLKEIHHRVKNNLQIISSLLNLQSRFIEDEEVKMVLQESRNRVNSMAFIHEKLYQSKDFSKIDFQDYLRTIANSLFYSYGVSMENVKLRIEMENFTIGIEQSIPIALILNEVITNSLKYAFPKGEKGEIYVSVVEQNGIVNLEMGDNGRGVADALEDAKKGSLGIELIETLAKQLEAKMSMENEDGLHYKFIFDKLN